MRYRWKMQQISVEELTVTANDMPLFHNLDNLGCFEVMA